MKKINFSTVTTLVLFCLLSKSFDVHAQGFSTSFTNWTLPAGGAVSLSGHQHGFYDIATQGSYYNQDQGWSTIDMNGDGKQDLVITSLGNGTNRDSFGVGSNPYWKVYLNTDSGFSTTYTNWTLPAGGAVSLSGHQYGFYNIATQGSYYNQDQGWSILDMNGDSKPDLVITSLGNGTNRDSFGVGSNPYWKVYLNTGSGFSTTSTNWTLPAGGAVSSTGHQYGFYNIATQGSYYNQDQGWSILDMNGDSKPDLVITSLGNGTDRNSFGVGSNPYWKVYLNTGSDFSTTSTNWTLPAGGAVSLSGHQHGFYDIATQGSYYNQDQGWSILDINGDSKPDLVITSLGNGTNRDSFGVGSNPYWKVYLNTGSGFSTTSTNWTLPAGGAVSLSGHQYGFYNIATQGSYYNQDQGWSILDMNGDSKPDLVITSLGNGTDRDSFGVGSNPYWKVYLNTGSGFSTTSTNWTLPAGGAVSLSGHQHGFYNIATQGSYYNQDQGWSILDMNGDSKPDLVITSLGNGTDRDSFGMGSIPYWKVYLNTAALENQQFENEKNIAIYPNPSSGKFTIKYQNEHQEINLEVYDMSGKKVLQQHNINEIDLTNYSKGIYLVKIYNDEIIYTEKIVIE